MPGPSADRAARRRAPRLHFRPMTDVAEDSRTIARDAPQYNASLVRREDATESLASFWVRFDGDPTPFEPGQYMTIGEFAEGKLMLRPNSVPTSTLAAGGCGMEFHILLVHG